MKMLAQWRLRYGHNIVLDEPAIVGADAEDLSGRRWTTDALTQPLLPQHSTETTDTDDADETETKADSFLVAAATALLVVGGVAASAAAMISAQSLFVYVAGAMCILDSYWVAVMQYAIAKGPGVRRTIHDLENESERLKEKVNNSNVIVNELQEKLKSSNEKRKKLNDIVCEQGFPIDKIISLVNENEHGLRQMKDCLREIAVADITRIVLSSDRDGDMRIDLKELEKLALRIELKLDNRGVVLDKKIFSAMVRKNNGDISHVIKVIAAIMFDESIDDRNVAEYAEEALQEEAHQNDLRESRRKMMAESRKIQKEHRQRRRLYGMLTLQGRLTRGSVDNARGLPVSLERAFSCPPSVQIKRRHSLDMPKDPEIGLSRNTV